MWILSLLLPWGGNKDAYSLSLYLLPPSHTYSHPPSTLPPLTPPLPQPSTLPPLIPPLPQPSSPSTLPPLTPLTPPPSHPSPLSPLPQRQFGRQSTPHQGRVRGGGRHTTPRTRASSRASSRASTRARDSTRARARIDSRALVIVDGRRWGGVHTERPPGRSGGSAQVLTS